MVEKRGNFLRVTQDDLSDEVAAEREKKMYANIVKRKKEIEAWLKSRGIITPKKIGEKKE